MGEEFRQWQPLFGVRQRVSQGLCKLPMEKSGFLHEGVRVHQVATNRIMKRGLPGLPLPGLPLRTGGLKTARFPECVQGGAFTLFELCLAVAIGVLILGLAVPSLRGVFADQKRNAVYEQFDDLVRRAQRLTVEERRACRLVWWRDAVVLVAEGGAEGGAAEVPGLGGPSGEILGELGRVGIGRGEVYGLERPHALVDKPPMEWPFWVGGTCEPVVVSYEGPTGRWKAVYDGLTGRSRLEGEALR
jgi:hypothetical protein